MDNSFDKLNEQFQDKKTGGVKYWIYLILTYACIVIAAGFAVYSFSNNQYIALLTLVFGLFGTQAVYKAKGTGEWNKATRLGFILSMVVIAIACVILYILPMFD